MSRVASLFEARRLRRASLVNLTLTDLLIVVVFVLLLFTFRSSEEGRVEITGLQAELQAVKNERNKLRDDLAVVREINYRLTLQIDELKALVARLLPDPARETLPVDPQTIIANLRRQNQQLQQELDSRNRLLSGQQKDLAEKDRQLQLQGQRGTGFPRCLVTSGYIFDIQLRESGNLFIKPAWEEGAETLARAVPGINELANGAQVPLEFFRQQAARMLAWSAAQDVPCRFHVSTRVESRTYPAGVYREQMKAIEDYFYAKK